MNPNDKQYQKLIEDMMERDKQRLKAIALEATQRPFKWIDSSLGKIRLGNN